MADRSRMKRAAVLAAAGLALTAAVVAGLPAATHAPATPVAGRSTAAKSATLAADLAVVQRAEASARALASAPGMPACAPPALPSPTFPPAAGYGIPFLAAITGGQILTGYDEYSANHHTWVVGSKTYHLYPWQAKIYDITGWVSGLLELPSLGATITPSDIVFCDTGGVACESASPPAGECIRISLHAAPVPGSAPSPPTTNVPAPGKACYQQTPECIPYDVVLNPVGNSQLSVTGVEANGSLDLTITTSAVTTLGITTPNISQTCSDGATALTLTSQLPSSLPTGSPVPPDAGNPDLRSLRTTPSPLSGPLGTATTTLATNDFSVPAFSTSACPLLAAVFDAPLGGWNALPSKDSANQNNNYFDKSPLPADAGLPGWVQFSATTTISDLGLPAGPPAGFSVSP
jgi:hypothetical protein